LERNFQISAGSVSPRASLCLPRDQSSIARGCHLLADPGALDDAFRRPSVFSTRKAAFMPVPAPETRLHAFSTTMPPSVASAARVAYRRVLRQSALTFTGDEHVMRGMSIQPLPLPVHPSRQRFGSKCAPSFWIDSGSRTMRNF
jgi:hypothetical protein